MSAVAVTQFLILPFYHFKEELGVLDSTPLCNYQQMRAKCPIITLHWDMCQVKSCITAYYHFKYQILSPFKYIYYKLLLTEIWRSQPADLKKCDVLSVGMD